MLGSSAYSQDWKKTELLVIGDSQLMFNGAQGYVDFFQNIGPICQSHHSGQSEKFEHITGLHTGILAVRSTAIDDFTTRKDHERERLCVPEESWPVNAKGYGTLAHRDQEWVQIGKHASFPFCKKDQSAFDVIFGELGAKPKVVVFVFLAGSTERWQNLALARLDAIALNRSIPDQTKCIFMTTAPTFLGDVNKRRKAAIESFSRALRENQDQCLFLDGFTPETVRKMSITQEYYPRSNDKNKVTDPFHPMRSGIDFYLKQNAKPVCDLLK